MTKLYKFTCFKVYYFIQLFYQTNLEVFIAEFRLNNYRQVGWSHQLFLTNLQIIRQSAGTESKALQRAIRHNPRQRYSSENVSSKSSKKNMLSELLKIFAEKIITNKLENMIYWAQRKRVYLPPDFVAGKDTSLFSQFIDKISKIDPLFQNKLYFYLAKEKVNYHQVDSFLNSYLLRHWPELADLVRRETSPPGGSQQRWRLDRGVVKDSRQHSDWKLRVLNESHLQSLQ